MEAFNELLASLPLQFDIRARLEDELARLSPEEQAWLQLPVPDLLLYYPISYYDEFGLSPVMHRARTALELIRLIKNNYQALVPAGTKSYYVQRRPQPYLEVFAAGPIRLHDLVGGRFYIDSISPDRILRLIF